MLLIPLATLLILKIVSASSEGQDFPVIYNLSPTTILSGFNENVTTRYNDQMNISLYNTKIQQDPSNPTEIHQILVYTNYLLQYKTERYGNIEFIAQHSAIDPENCHIEMHMVSNKSSESLPDQLTNFIWQNLSEKIQENYCMQMEQIRNSVKFLDISNGNRKSSHFVKIQYIGENQEENVEISQDFINSELSKLFTFANTVIHWPEGFGAKSTLANIPKIEIAGQDSEVRLTTLFTTVISLEGDRVFERLTKIEAKLRDIRVWRHNLDGELMWSAKYKILNKPDIGFEFSTAKLEKFLHKNIRGTLPMKLVSNSPKWLLPHVSIAVPRGNSLFFAIPGVV